MNASELLTELRTVGAKLWVEGDELKLKAPKGALTAELRGELKRNKASLIAMLAPAEEDAAIPIASRDEPVPLSSTQERLWFLDQLEPGLTAYNLWFGVRLKGELDIDALERTVTTIADRHEVLRASFVSHEDGPVQVFADAVPISLTPVQKGGKDLADEDELKRHLLDICRAPYDLATGPLFRAALGRVSETEHIFVFGMHHSVSDGWSMGTITDELLETYPAFAAGEKPVLPELTHQFADYAVWQRAFLKSPEFSRQLEFWREKLGGDLPVLQFPADRPRPSVQSFAGDNERLKIPLDRIDALTELAKEEGATLFMALLAIYKTLIFRTTGEEDILVGTPIASRNRPEFHHLVGYFANTLVIRSDMSRQPTFRELLRRVRDNSLDAYDNQDAPFERLVDTLAPERDLATTPVFQTLFSLEESPPSNAKFGELDAEYLDLVANVARMDMTLGVFRSTEGATLWAEYCTDLFNADTVARLLTGFNALLEGALANPDTPITHLPLLTAEERQRILIDWNDTHHDIREDACADQLFEEQADRTPNAVAVVTATESVTYGEIEARANQLAHYLRDLGAGAGKPVAIAAGRTVEMVVGVLATMKAGSAYIPIDLDYPAERLAYIFEDVGARVVLTLEREAHRLPATDRDVTRVIKLDCEKEAIDAQPTDRIERTSTPGSLAYVIYTSGSTGKPKGVALGHTGLVNLITWHRRVYNVTPETRATHLAGLAFDAAVWELWPYLTAGSRLYLVPDDVRLSPPGLLAWMAERGITQSFVPTPLAEACVREQMPTGLALDYMFTGGDKLRRAPESQLPFELVNHYGPTENTVVATATTVSFEAPGGQLAPPPPSIGGPIDNVRVYLLDAYGQPVPVGVAGELFIAGKSLAQGYFGRDDLTDERFAPNPAVPGERVYATGDSARWTPDGEIEFVGRLDNQVKVRGFRIELGEVEAVLGALDAVTECVVTMREDVAGDPRLVAYVVMKSDDDGAEQVLRTSLGETLPDYMVPSHFVFLDEFPLTPNGKVAIKRLPAPVIARDEETEFAAPSNEIERRMSEIWREVLGVERVGVHDNFFQLGGNSILSTQAMARIREAFDVDIPLRVLFELPTVAALAKRAGGEDADEVAKRSYGAVFDQCLIPLQPRGWRKALFIVSGAHAHEDDFLRFVGTLLPHMREDQPVYGFKARGLDGVSQPHANAQEMAAQYVREMRELQPEGPYLIAGNCVGGIVAFEMGQQLRAMGEEAALLALLDTVAPIKSYRDFVDDHFRFWKLSRFRGHLGKLSGLSMSEKFSYFFSRLGRKARGVAPMSEEARRKKHIQGVERRYSSVLAHYEPQSYAGKVTLVVNEEVHAELPDAGWGQWISGELDIRVIAGDHVTRLTENAAPSADILETCIDEALSNGEVAGVRSAAS